MGVCGSKEVQSPNKVKKVEQRLGSNQNNGNTQSNIPKNSHSVKRQKTKHLVKRQTTLKRKQEQEQQEKEAAANAERLLRQRQNSRGQQLGGGSTTYTSTNTNPSPNPNPNPNPSTTNTSSGNHSSAQAHSSLDPSNANPKQMAALAAAARFDDNKKRNESGDLGKKLAQERKKNANDHGRENYENKQREKQGFFVFD
ncbi:unnamed protein product [Ambrosiozyma monospora]|uniref:Unnamed protein product n=1 Tax=Ambrosiozyma monospora TaxID=43982 RepID=A0A9W6Z196_AMBMO|nr:unnamed protein product [Ambrosiozyma monospora]